MDSMLNCPLYVHTPLWESLPLRRLSGKQLFLKMECFQPTGSFKNRGVARLCQFYAKEGKTRFVSPSGGNAGYTTAFIARKLGLKATVVVPKTAQQVFIDKIKIHDGEVIVYGDSIDEAKEKAMYIVQADKTAALITSFDHPLIWEGNSTIIDEVVEQVHEKPDAIVASVGGGGLACGILQGIHRHDWGDIPFFGVETEGAASMAATLKAARLVTLPRIDSIAVTLGLKTITQELFEWSKKHTIVPITVTDRQSVDAMRRFLDDHRILVEPACSATLATIYDAAVELESYKKILIIVCGGVGINYNILKHYLATV